MAEDIERLRRHVEALHAGTHPAAGSARVLAGLRYDLFCLVADIPRPRDARGRYVSSGLSAEYDRARAVRS